MPRRCLLAAALCALASPTGGRQLAQAPAQLRSVGGFPCVSDCVMAPGGLADTFCSVGNYPNNCPGGTRLNGTVPVSGESECIDHCVPAPAASPPPPPPPPPPTANGTNVTTAASPPPLATDATAATTLLPANLTNGTLAGPGQCVQFQQTRRNQATSITTCATPHQRNGVIATAVLGPSGLILLLVAAFALRSRNRANNQKLLVGHLADVQMHLASAQPGTPEYASLTAQAADITSALSDLPTIQADLAAAKGGGKTTGAYRAEKANEATLLIQRHRLDTWEGVQFAVPWTHMLALAALVVLLFVLPLVYVQLVYAKSSYTCSYSAAAGGCVVGPASTSLSLTTA